MEINYIPYMNLRDLEYFIAVVEENHFGKAAHKCFVSQPTLSGQIKKLESELGIVLFERNNRKVRLSEAGHKILPKVKEVLQASNDIKNIADGLVDPMSGNLKLGCIPTMASSYLPLVIPEIEKSFPNVTLSVFEQTTKSLIADLHNANVDIALLALPIKEKGLVGHSIGFEDFYLAMSKEHSMSQFSKVSSEKIKGAKILLLEEGHCFREQALEVCQLSGAREDTRYKATSFQTIKELIKMNQGITLVPAKIAHSWKDDASLTIIPFSKPIPTREVGLLYRDISIRKPLLLAVAKCLQKALGITSSNKQRTVMSF